MIHGILVVDKKEGPTSRKVVDIARRTLRVKKCGHLGTLDPFATGILPLCLGKATRLARFLSGGDKWYEGTFRLGETSDTLDRTGEILTRAALPDSLDSDSLQTELTRFEGVIDQIPPMYSARKVNGTRLYQLARRGLTVERRPAQVSIHRFSLLGLDGPDARFHLRCSSGTYVRALARDLGNRIGCGALVSSLRRVFCQPFTVQDAIAQGQIEDDPDRDRILGAVIPLERIELGMPRIRVGETDLKRIRNGEGISCPDLPSDKPISEAGSTVCIHGEDGSLAAVARFEPGPPARLQPQVVLISDDGSSNSK